MLLATSALASAALPAMAAPGDATWNPGNADFNADANWTGTPDKKTPIGIATFNASSQQTITFSKDTSLGGMTVNQGAGDYIFDTNGTAITFTGAGLSVGSSASLVLNNNGASLTTFSGDSTAGQALININDGGVTFTGQSKAGSSILNVNRDPANNIIPALTFAGGSSADQAKITNSARSRLDFQDTSSAGAATIANNGVMNFFTHSTAGQANITSQTTGFSTLLVFQDSSSAGAATITIVSDTDEVEFRNAASAATARITNSSKNFGFTDGSTAGQAHITNDSHGQIGFFKNSTAGQATIDNSGSVSFEKSSTAADATIVNHGNLDFSASSSAGNAFIESDGAISFHQTASGGTAHITLDAGGTLDISNLDTAGTTVGSLKGSGNVFLGNKNLAVGGSLTFTAAATYLIQVSPTTAANTHVTGTATLGGATVVANFTPGTYVTHQYTILTAAGGLNGTTFSPLVSTTNLSPLFKAALSYDANDVFLDLSPNSGAISGLNTNQRNVANAIGNSLLMGGLPDASFMTLSPAGLTQISGETALGTQQATFDAMNQFMGVMLDPTVGALSGGRAFAQANDAYAAMPRKAPLSAGAFDARWGAWAAGFGGSQSVSGDAVLGSNKTTSNVFGTAAGAEYRFSPNTVAGFALAGGGTHFNVANGGSGNSDLFQAGAYLRHTQGAAFIAAALAYGWQDVTTNRTVTVAGIDSLRARFNANAVSGRLEGGYRVATPAGDLTPYAAGQFTTYRLPSYVEQATAGANTFALSYNGKDVTATRTELGLRSEKAVALTDSTLVLRGRLAWAHDYNTDRNVQAAFVTLPGSAFVVNGAQPAADTALTTLSAETLWRNGWSAALTADAQLSDTTHSYSGKGVVRYSW
jgi:uncharacterized protein with beta-barrel porin domain